MIAFFISILIGGAGFQPRATIHTSRVANDVEEYDIGICGVKVIGF